MLRRVRDAPRHDQGHRLLHGQDRVETQRGAANAKRGTRVEGESLAAALMDGTTEHRSGECACVCSVTAGVSHHVYVTVYVCTANGATQPRLRLGNPLLRLPEERKASVTLSWNEVALLDFPWLLVLFLFRLV